MTNAQAALIAASNIVAAQITARAMNNKLDMGDEEIRTLMAFHMHECEVKLAQADEFDAMEAEHQAEQSIAPPYLFAESCDAPLAEKDSITASHGYDCVWIVATENDVPVNIKYKLPKLKRFHAWLGQAIAYLGGSASDET